MRGRSPGCVRSGGDDRTDVTPRPARRDDPGEPTRSHLDVRGNIMRWIRIAGAVTLAAAAVTSVQAGVANADGPRRAELRTATVAYGPACVGQVFAQMVSTRVSYPGPGFPRAGQSWRRVHQRRWWFRRRSDHPGRPCRVTTTVRWRNLRTGASGVVAGPTSGNLVPPAPQEMVSRVVRTGSGARRMRGTWPGVMRTASRFNSMPSSLRQTRALVSVMNPLWRLRARSSTGCSATDSSRPRWRSGRGDLVNGEVAGREMRPALARALWTPAR